MAQTGVSAWVLGYWVETKWDMVTFVVERISPNKPGHLILQCIQKLVKTQHQSPLVFRVDAWCWVAGQTLVQSNREVFGSYFTVLNQVKYLAEGYQTGASPGTWTKNIWVLWHTPSAATLPTALLSHRTAHLSTLWRDWESNGVRSGESWLPVTRSRRRAWLKGAPISSSGLCANVRFQLRGPVTHY